MQSSLHLVSSGCHNTIPQTGWFKQQTFNSLTVLETGSSRSGCWHDSEIWVEILHKIWGYMSRFISLGMLPLTSCPCHYWSFSHPKVLWPAISLKAAKMGNSPLAAPFFQVSALLQNLLTLGFHSPVPLGHCYCCCYCF